MHCKLSLELFHIDDRTGAEKQPGVRGSIRPRRKVVIDLYGVVKHLVARVRAADPYKQLVLGGDVGDDVALALAAVLTANEYVDQTFDGSRVETQQSRR